MHPAAGDRSRPEVGRHTPALSAPTREWFAAAFTGPTPAQLLAWEAIGRGDDTLVVAPTGSGKTLAAFLHAIDRLVEEPPPIDPLHRCRVLYVSPLKALAVDVERNLRLPLAGVRAARERAGLPSVDVKVGLRTGDTATAERARQARRPPDIWITTPESLYLLLTSSARKALVNVTVVILDEVHALAGTKRGAHLAVCLERLDALRVDRARSPRTAQRIALSATVAPVDVVADFVRPGHHVHVVAPPTAKQWDLQVRVPVPDLGSLDEAPSVRDPAGRVSIWPHLDERLVDLIEEHDSTLVFVNSRGQAERITARINDIAAEREPGAPPPARAHHGSVSREQRSTIESDLKSGRLAAVVATSSLELGIDMGAVDLVVQIEAPPSVASGLQRVGRSGHHVGAVSKGIVFPKHRGDLLTCAVAVAGMRTGRIEEVRIPRLPLDVLAQQVVAAVSMDDWLVADLLALVRRTAAFADLPSTVFEAVLDMLSGRYPSDDFADLRPRIVWDREADTLRTRPGAHRLAVTNAGTISDRGLYTVHIVGSDRSRVGELDEEMVYESRVGDVIALGASSWRIEEITHDRVLVTPAPGQPGRMPFWHGDALGRPAAFGQAVGALVRRITTAADPAHELADAALDPWATDNLVRYVTDQRAATGAVPSDTTIVIERYRDELGDWRVVVHSPFGARVNAPWALAIGAALRRRNAVDPQLMPADDGIVLRLPDADLDSDVDVRTAVAVDPEDIERIVTAEIGATALFAGRFRECAARALLLPRRRPDRRVPLWQQRRRAQQLLDVASAHPDFPIVLEAMRECLQDVYDVPALAEVLRRIRDGLITMHEVTTDRPSPFARSLAFSYVATFLYEGDAPLAERRAQALTVDAALLAELLGTADLRDLLDADVLDEIERELQRRTPRTAVRSAEDLADALREIGPLSQGDLSDRGVATEWVTALIGQRRARWIPVAGTRCLAGADDRLEVGDVVRRFARTHTAFSADDAATRLGLPTSDVVAELDRLVARSRVIRGAFRPGGSHTEYVDDEVLRRIRRRTMARLRAQIEPVASVRYAAFLPTWQKVAEVGAQPRLHGTDGVRRVVEQLAGAAIPASTWLRAILPVRVATHSPTTATDEVDHLIGTGEIRWWGVGALPGMDGLIALAPADLAGDLHPPTAPIGAVAERIHDVLTRNGALFFREITQLVGTDGGEALVDAAIVEGLWDLVWAGHATNDSWAALRARLAATHRPRPPGSAHRRRLGPLRDLSPPRHNARSTAPVGPSHASGRWSLLAPAPATFAGDPRRVLALADALVDRAGILTRADVLAADFPGGWQNAYRVLSAAADAGRYQRLYAIEGLGGAQFAGPTAIEALRSPGSVGVLALAATDPANAYGGALPWPAPPGGTHRPARVAGASVVLVDGRLVVYLERGGRSLLVWPHPEPDMSAALAALPAAARLGGGRRAAITRVNGLPITAAWIEHLTKAGLRPSPSGPRLPD